LPQVGEDNNLDLNKGAGEHLKLESDLIMATNPVSQQPLQSENETPFNSSLPAF